MSKVISVIYHDAIRGGEADELESAEMLKTNFEKLGGSFRKAFTDDSATMNPEIMKLYMKAVSNLKRGIEAEEAASASVESGSVTATGEDSLPGSAVVPKPNVGGALRKRGGRGRK